MKSKILVFDPLLLCLFQGMVLWELVVTMIGGKVLRHVVLPVVLWAH